MKNRKNSLVTALLAIVTLVFVGCSNNFGGGTIKGVDGGCNVSIQLTNFSDSSARTIAPNAISKDAADDYIFIAEGTEYTRNKTFDPLICDIENGKLNLLQIPAGVWTITITMYEKALLTAAGVSLTDADAIDSAKATCAVLSGTTKVDVNKANVFTKVTLTPDGIGTEGKVALKIAFNADDVTTISDKSLTVKAGLYKKFSDDVIGSSEQTISVIAATTPDTANYSVTGVPKGLYTFKVTITSADGTTGPWYYSDDIYIEGNRETAQDVTVPKLIGATPTAPTNFAWTPSVNNAELGHYKADFTWERNSYNESGFEVQIIEVADTSATLGAGSFANETTGLFTEENFASTEYLIYAKEGSLLAGSTSISYNLQYGKVYVARIRAVNYNGNSDWAYIGTLINRYTVTYDFTGYKLQNDSEAIKNKTVDFGGCADTYNVKYTPYDAVDNTDGYKLYNLTENTDEEIAWAGWRNVADNTGLTTYTGYQNLVLALPKYLDFDIESSGTYAKILDGKLFAGARANPTGAATEITYANGSVENLYVAISAANVPAGIEILEVTYALVRNDGTIYSPSAVVSGANFASSFALIDIPAGDYTLKAEAKLSTGYIVTTQIQLAIK